MTQYKLEFPFPSLFPPISNKNVLAEWLEAKVGLFCFIFHFLITFKNLGRVIKVENDHCIILVNYWKILGKGSAKRNFSRKLMHGGSYEIFGLGTARPGHIPFSFPNKNKTKREKSKNIVILRIFQDVSQYHCAETEKYAHVTFFFNGGMEKQFTNEERCLVPSPKVATYDLQPEMSCQVRGWW